MARIGKIRNAQIILVGKNDGNWTQKIILCRLQMDTCVPVHLMFDGLVYFSVLQPWVFHEEKEFCVGFCK